MRTTKCLFLSQGLCHWGVLTDMWSEAVKKKMMLSVIIRPKFQTPGGGGGGLISECLIK